MEHILLSLPTSQQIADDKIEASRFIMIHNFVKDRSQKLLFFFLLERQI